MSTGRSYCRFGIPATIYTGGGVQGISLKTPSVHQYKLSAERMWNIGRGRLLSLAQVQCHGDSEGSFSRCVRADSNERQVTGS